MADPPEMTRDAAHPTVEALRRRLLGHRTAQLLAAAVRLGLPEALGAGDATAAELADAVGAAPAPLAGALEALVEHGVLDRSSPGRYRLTATGALLRRDAPGGLAALALEVGTVDYATWGELLHQLTTDESAFARAHGASWFERRAGADRGLYREMAATAGPIARAVAATADLSTARRLIDVGGGAGGLLLELLALLPAAEGILFDLEAVRADAEEAIAAAGLGRRCRFEGGSFFEPLPAGGDLYLLLRVLRNWGDEAAIRLLRRVARALAGRNGSRLLVIDPVPPDPPQPPPLELEARRYLRTRSELASLFERSGLALIEVAPLPEWGSIVVGTPRIDE